jgi:hypothetical protein
MTGGINCINDVFGPEILPEPFRINTPAFGKIQVDNLTKVSQV